MTKPEVVHHDRKAYDIVNNIIEAHWAATKYFGTGMNLDRFLSEEEEWAHENYRPSDPVEAAKWDITPAWEVFTGVEEARAKAEEKKALAAAG
jgi:hypothetical protein